MKPLIIFDFDGTLADSIDAIVDVINELADEKHIAEFVSQEELRNTPLARVIRKRGVPFWRVPALITQAYEKLTSRVVRMKPHRDIPELLKELAPHVRMAIVSGNDPRIIERFLRIHKLDAYFEIVDGKHAFWKNRIITRVRKSLGVDKDRVVYVGDEDRDMHAARRAGVTGLAVTWGVHNEELLLRTRPKMLARTPQEAKELLLAWAHYDI